MTVEEITVRIGKEIMSVVTEGTARAVAMPSMSIWRRHRWTHGENASAQFSLYGVFHPPPPVLRPSLFFLVGTGRFSLGITARLVVHRVGRWHLDSF